MKAERLSIFYPRKLLQTSNMSEERPALSLFPVVDERKYFVRLLSHELFITS